MNPLLQRDIQRLDEAVGVRRELPARDGFSRTFHVFEQEDIDAVQVALATRRPLLVRGEPGTGKTQLARAVTEVLGRALVARVVDAQTETLDLLWTLDAVSRLARAQVLGLQKGVSVDQVDELMKVGHFIRPGALWWGFDWESASQQSPPGADRPIPPTGWTTDLGVVVLVDEIDKADVAVPNALLDAFGQGRFHVDGYGTVSMRGSIAPLVIVTTNEERVLPDAFLRRCVVRQIVVKEAEYESWLLRRGLTHRGETDRAVLEAAARVVMEHRKSVGERGLCAPGGAEYIDLLDALDRLAPNDLATQQKMIARLAPYVLDKHPPEPSR